MIFLKIIAVILLFNLVNVYLAGISDRLGKTNFRQDGMPFILIVLSPLTTGIFLGSWLVTFIYNLGRKE